MEATMIFSRKNKDLLEAVKVLNLKVEDLKEKIHDLEEKIEASNLSSGPDEPSSTHKSVREELQEAQQFKLELNAYSESDETEYDLDLLTGRL